MSGSRTIRTVLFYVVKGKNSSPKSLSPRSLFTEWIFQFPGTILRSEGLLRGQNEKQSRCLKHKKSNGVIDFFFRWQTRDCWNGTFTFHYRAQILWFNLRFEIKQLNQNETSIIATSDYNHFIRCGVDEFQQFRNLIVVPQTATKPCLDKQIKSWF